MKKYLLLLIGVLLMGCSAMPKGEYRLDTAFEYQESAHVLYGSQPDRDYLMSLETEVIVIDTRYDVHGFLDDGSYYLDNPKTAGRSIIELFRWEKESGLLAEQEIVTNYYRIPVKENSQPDALAVDKLIEVLQGLKDDQKLFIHGRLLDSGVKAMAGLVECYYDDNTDLECFDERFRSYVKEFKAGGFDRSYNDYLLTSH